jgi:integrase
MSNPPTKIKRPAGERKYLTSEEVERLLKSVRKIGRNTHRDYCLVLMMYRHGLRVSEAIALEWRDIDWQTATIYIKRLKNGKPANHPIKGDELRVLRQLQRNCSNSIWLFNSERQAPLSDRTVRDIVARAGESAGLGAIHPHQLRHSCGYWLASQGLDTRLIQDYLGHQNINHTVRYTELAPGRFDGIDW